MAQVRALHSLIGNRAVARMVQAKLTVGRADDPYEREADAVAAQVMRAVEPTDVDLRISRRAHAHDSLDGATVDGAQEAAISRPGGGSQLPDGVRTSMESAFGRDLSDVRVHQGVQADSLSRSLHATAFTTGSNIFFSRGTYQPGSRSGRQLLAHELTHVVQQGGAGQVRRSGGRIQRELNFTGTNWTKAKKVTAASGGVNPVRLVDNLVIKGLASGGAQQQFASIVYGGLVNAPKTRAVQRDSDEGREIEAMMSAKLMPAFQPTVTVFLVMEKVALKSLEDFGKELEDPDDLNNQRLNKLRKPKKEMKKATSFDSVIANIFGSDFFEDLGKIHAVDLFLGNQDRMDRYGEVAMQNVFLAVENGNVRALGLDLDVEAASLEVVKGAGTKTTGTKKAGNQKQWKANAADEHKDWVNYAIKGPDAQRKLVNVQDDTDTTNVRIGKMPGTMDSTDVSALFDPARINLAIDEFRANLEKWFPKPATGGQPANEKERRGDMISTPYFTNTLWPLAKTKFTAGIDEGIKTILLGMTKGGQYEYLYRQSLANNPQDELFDFAVLQIRARYMKQKREQAASGLSDAQIMADLEQFAQMLSLEKTKAKARAKLQKTQANKQKRRGVGVLAGTRQ